MSWIYPLFSCSKMGRPIIDMDLYFCSGTWPGRQDSNEKTTHPGFAPEQKYNPISEMVYPCHLQGHAGHLDIQRYPSLSLNILKNFKKNTLLFCPQVFALKIMSEIEDVSK